MGLVVYQITSKWDVPLMVTRGYPSISFLHQAAEAIQYEDKPTYLYYFGDWDPSGVHIPQNVADRLQEFGATVKFKRIAVTPDQVGMWKLPTRPTKKSDTRSKNFNGASVELDAIPPDQLRKLVEDCIVQHVDQDKLEKTKTAEASERELLSNWDDILEEYGADFGLDGGTA
jgi:hypothetical protein